MKLGSHFLVPFLALAPALGESNSLPRSSPEAQGIDSNRLLECVATLDTETENIHSFMLVRHGHVVAEGWWAPYAPEHNHVLFSLSKSFASTGIGLAAAEGKLNIDDPVLNFFPEDAPDSPSYLLKEMRVRDLLSMSTGHEQPPSSKPDVVSAKSFLAEEVPHQPGTHFRYNTAATFMLSAIVQKQTGETLVDYLKPRLFEPLGIEKPVWDTNYQGISLGGYGLRVRTEDIAKLGQLYLQDGKWNGKRLLQKEWVSEATSKQVSNGSNPKSDWAQGYGYQFWRCRHGAYRGDGAFGQYCIVLPEMDAVVAITSGLKDMQGVMNTLWDKLLPAFHYVALSENPTAESALKSKLESLVLPPVKGEASSPILQHISGKRFTFPENEKRIESLLIEPSDGALHFTLVQDGKTVLQPCGHGKWTKATEPINEEPTAASFGWEKNTLTIKQCHFETPFVTTTRLQFDKSSVGFSQKVNVAFGGVKPVTLTGKATE